MSVIQKLQELLSDTGEPLSLAQDGLLKSERLYETKYSIEDQLREISKELDERSQLSIEKVIPKWRNVPKHGIFVSGEETVKQLTPLISLLQELIVKFSPITKNVEMPRDEVIIEKGKPYDGRRYLRELFNFVRESIYIRDSYLRPEILDILSEYILDNPKIKLRFLIGNNFTRRTAFSDAFKKFLEQYKADAEGRCTNEDNKDHPRYILIDGTLVFVPDNSLDQWGLSTVHINQIIKTENKDIIFKIFENEWNKGEKIQ